MGINLSFYLVYCGFRRIVKKENNDLLRFTVVSVHLFFWRFFSCNNVLVPPFVILFKFYDKII